MAVRIDVSVIESNNETGNFQILTGVPPSSPPYNLTGKTVTVWIKKSSTTPDSDPTTLQLSSAGGSPPVTITNAGLGQGTVQIPLADLATPGPWWYRIDVTTDSKTAIYGMLNVIPV